MGLMQECGKGELKEPWWLPKALSIYAIAVMDFAISWDGIGEFRSGSQRRSWSVICARRFVSALAKEAGMTPQNFVVVAGRDP